MTSKRPKLSHPAESDPPATHFFAPMGPQVETSEQEPERPHDRHDAVVPHGETHSSETVSDPDPYRANREKAFAILGKPIYHRQKPIPVDENDASPETSRGNTTDADVASSPAEDDPPDDNTTNGPTESDASPGPTSDRGNSKGRIELREWAGPQKLAVVVREVARAEVPQKRKKKDRPHHVPKPHPKMYQGFPINLNYAPVSDHKEMFKEATSIGVSLGLANAVDDLKDFMVNVATMCSGTEAPLIALREVCDNLERHFDKKLRIFHQFSAEIEPRTQAYVERNFHPRILFRDVRELGDPKRTTAHTAYGALVDIPKSVDILVAGFPCVDFSTLNPKRKRMAENGESGEVLRAIMNYAKKYGPAVILLENVEHAEWELIKAQWENDRTYARKMMSEEEAELWLIWDESNPGYYCDYNIYDTKHFFIPHTRRRGYMFLVRKDLTDSGDAMINSWLDLFEMMKRPASSSVGAFVLPEDDPHLQRSREELSRTLTIRSEVDWTLCQGRHQNYRYLLRLGTQRPYTRWIEGGIADFPEFGWRGWFEAQVERIYDTLEIAYLRRAVSRNDTMYRERVWELSQNVDRDKDTHPTGLTGCMTPTGMPYLTTRGGPIVGREVLAFQGLPAKDLILTKETDRFLQQLAGNAMTTTVIGAAIMCAIIAGNSALVKNIRQRNPEACEEIVTVGNTLEDYMDTHFLQLEKVLIFGEVIGIYAEELCAMAWRSVRFCLCEGPIANTPNHVMVCKDCGHHSCDKCGILPVHNYTRTHIPARMHPQDGKLLLENVLLMRLRLGGLTGDHLDEMASSFLDHTSSSDWSIVKQAAILMNEAEFRFSFVKRTHWLTVIYMAPGARLELVIHRDRVRCFLYGVPDPNEPGNSRVRQLLKYPIARKTIHSGDILGTVRENDEFDTQWQFCIPTTHSFDLTIKGKGRKVASWQAKLGLLNFEDQQVWSSVEIEYKTEPVLPLDRDLRGEYQSLPECGMACSSLHQQVRPADGQTCLPDLFFFLDPDPIGEPAGDEFVFSTELHRLEYSKTRHIIARLECSWRQSAAEVSTAKCHVFGTWVTCSASLRVFKSSNPVTYQAWRIDSALDICSPTSLLSLDSNGVEDNCKSGALAMLSLSVPLDTAQPDGQRYGFQTTDWKAVPQADEHEEMRHHYWMCSRARSLDHFAGNWRPINVPQNLQVCQSCAPICPDIKWAWAHPTSGSSTRKRIVPYEDQRQAGAYERALKNRPPAFSIRQRINTDALCGELQIGLNVASLVHRAIAKLENPVSSGLPAPKLTISWRLDTDYREPSKFEYEAFRLRNNDTEPEAVFDFPLQERRLFREQKRVLHWMLNQESATTTPWIEQEIEEARLNPLCYLAHACVKREVRRMGGVLADIVGYGKTATTLALAHRRKPITEEESTVPCKGYIPLKATLVVVPPTLVIQWETEIRKFLGQEPNVRIIDKAINLTSTTVQHFKEADFIIVNVDVLKSASYWRRLAHLTGLPEGPNIGGRPFDSWRDRTRKELQLFVEDLLTKDTDEKMQKLAEALQEKSEKAEEDEELLRELPTKYKKGAGYVHYNDGGANNAAGADDQINDDPMETVDDKVADDERVADDQGHAEDQDISDEENPDDQGDPDAMEIDKDDVVNDEEPTGDQGKANKGKARGKKGALDLSRETKDGFVPRNYNGISEAKNWSDMKGIVFELFRFARIVNDEYTFYPSNLHGALKSLNAPRKWLLSGTPRHSTFSDIRTMAGLMGVNLGVLDDATGIYPSDYSVITRIDKSEAENFRAYGYVYTMAWHGMRHQHAQTFLDQFVRQNMPKISKLPVQQSIQPHSMYAIENVTHKELQYQIESTNFKVVRRSTKLAQDDRAEHVNRLLRDSDTFREALLKSSAYFDMGFEGTVSGGAAGFSAIILRRQEQLQQYADSMKKTLRHAVWLAKQCRRSNAAKDAKDALFEQWIGNIQTGQAGDKYATKIITKLIIFAQKNYSADDEDEFYRDKPDEEELAVEVKKKTKGKRTTKKGATDKGPPKDERLFKIEHDNFPNYQSGLRLVVKDLRKSTKQLTLRVRSLRYANRVAGIVAYKTGGGPPPRCENCRVIVSDLDDIVANVACGHLVCRSCLALKAWKQNCLIKYCEAAAPNNRLKPAREFTGKNEDLCRYGGKLDAIILLIHSIPEDEQILMFVQYETLMKQIADAFNECKISNFALTEDKRSQSGNVIEEFKHDTTNKKLKVLILNASNDTAAGTNLVNANHIIFVSPLDTHLQYLYNASRTQCVGRALRYGQERKVHVYDFLALNTFDVDTYEQREGKKLVYRGSEQSEPWVMVERGKVTVDEKKQDWGSGFHYEFADGVVRKDG